MFLIASGCVLLVLCYLLFLSMGYVAGQADRRIGNLEKGLPSLGVKSRKKPVEKHLGVDEMDRHHSAPNQGTSSHEPVFGQREVAC